MQQFLGIRRDWGRQAGNIVNSRSMEAMGGIIVATNFEPTMFFGIFFLSPRDLFRVYNA